MCKSHLNSLTSSFRSCATQGYAALGPSVYIFWLYLVNTFIVPVVAVDDALAGTTPALFFYVFAGTALAGIFCGILLLAGLSGSAVISDEVVEWCFALEFASMFLPGLASTTFVLFGTWSSSRTEAEEERQVRAL